MPIGAAFDSANGDFDLAAGAAVYNDTPDATATRLCIVSIQFGDGVKNLDGTGGDFTLEITFAGAATLQPNPQTITFDTAVISAIGTEPFLVPANTAVAITVTSPNAGDSDVDVTTTFYDLQPLALPAVAAGSENGLPVVDANNYVAGVQGAKNTLDDLNDFDGTEATLHSDYDAAKTAAQAGDEMDLVNAPNATAITAIQSGLSTFDGTEATLHSDYDAAKTAAQAGDEMLADLRKILGTALTESTPGWIAAAVKKLFDVETPLLVASDVMRGTDSAATAAKLLAYVQLLARSDSAIETDNATELTAINADGGSGAGDYSSQTDAQEKAGETVAKLDNMIEEV